MAAESKEERNLRRSIFSIDFSKSPRSLPMRKGTACAVKTEGSARALLVTSRKVVDHGGSSAQGKLSYKQFCPKYPKHEDKHLVKGTFQLRFTEQFCFILLQAAPKSRGPKYSLNLVGASKLRKERERLTKSTCLSYTFFGNSFKTMTWEFNKEEQTHELTKVDPKGDLVRSACRGSPVVSTQDEDRSVIGVVDCTLDGDLHLLFFKESSLDIEELRVGPTDEDALDVTDSPYIPHESPPPIPPPEEKQSTTERGNNSSQEPGATNYNGRESAAKRLPEENTCTPQGGGSPASSAKDLSRALLNIAVQETDLSATKKLSKERTSEENKCIWDKEVKSLESFQDLLTTVLKINLDPKRELGGDYRSLAGALGKNMKYIWYLETTPSPVEELLKNCENPISLRLLNALLSSEEIRRKDVAKEISDWVTKQRCNCSECGSIC